MKIYLAASYARKDELRGYRADLMARGHEVTSRWLDEPDGATFAGSSVEEMAVAAVKAIEDINRSDAIVRFSDGRDAAVAGGGRHVEWGWALCRSHITMVLIGEPQHPFDCWRRVHVERSWGTFLLTLDLDAMMRP